MRIGVRHVCKLKIISSTLIAKVGFLLFTGATD